MQLKKIEIQGFKSFANKTEIVFLDGITTIVGPNGSGKSNISDAVRWVLGEQSVKTLRGSKMEDVIFAGTQSRKKVGFAEVSMYLDNLDGSLPVDYNEVVVTRRVYRSGESNYLINGSECRLKDIQELFMDTGVGKDGYSIISQGKIDEILSSKSEERRHIFEEASGIVKYRTRKDEAAKKLSNTETSLSRVSDILNEIENTIGPLEERAKKAKNYLKLREELKMFDVKLFIHDIDKNKKDLIGLEETIESLTQSIEQEELVSIEDEKTKISLKDRFAEISEKIEKTNQKYFELENEQERLNSKINVSNTQIESANENITRIKNEINEDTEKIEVLKEEINYRLQKRESMSENKKKFEEELEEKQGELTKLALQLDDKALEMEGLKQSIDIKQEEKYEYKTNISSMLATIEANEKQIEEKKKLEQKNILQKDSLSIEKDELYNELNKSKQKLDQVVNYLDELNVELNTKLKEASEQEQEKDKLNQEIMTLKSKYNYLLNLDHENEGYFKSVKSALSFSKKNNIAGVYGTVASLISTNEKYEYAIEISLGGYLQNIVVEDEKKANEIIAYLKQNSLGRATFLPIQSIREFPFDKKSKYSSYPGFIDTAVNLVKYDKKYEKAINLALGNTIIVDNVENAIAMSKKTKNQVKIVTLDGELIATTGSITGGKTFTKSAGLIGRNEKIEKLKLEIDSKTKEHNKASEVVTNMKERMQVLQSVINEQKDAKDSLSIEVATYNEKYEAIKRDFEKTDKLKEADQTAIEDLKSQDIHLQEEIKRLELEIKVIDEYIDSNQKEIDDYVSFNKEKGKELEYLNEDILNLKISLSSFDESVASIDEMKSKIEQDIDNFKNGIERKNEQVQGLLKNIEELNENIKQIQEDMQNQVNFKEEYLSVCNTLKISKEDILKRQDEIDLKISEGLKKIEKIKEERAKVEGKKVKFDLEEENIKNKMWDEYELTISSSKKLLESMDTTNDDPKNINKLAESIRKEIKALGEIHIGSIEEYQNTKERYDFIFNQKEDLEQTKHKLENLITNMTSIMKGQFAKQFAIISENFNETFKELFGGGKAELKLADESNILESGIDIEVQPPGKKLQSMMLLSGGERALTATALLFAILKIKSPPFCILDEIEAALDDVNVTRFADYIKKYSNSTQFIVITHRKGTMEVASSVYGVTMQEYGISKIISMKLK